MKPGDPADETHDLSGEPEVPGDPEKLLQILEECEDHFRRGEPIPREEILARHPEIRNELDSCLSGLEFIHRAGGFLKPTREGRTGEETTPQVGGFRIIRELGRGGMGVVYEAEQLSLKRRVALKVLRYGSLGDPEILRRFRKEAEMAARLHHTNLVPIYAVGEEGGVHYYAMQLIEGESLAEKVERRRALPPDRHHAQEVARLGLQAAEALAYAHERGVIHRDIKPSNLLVDPEGTLWITDFGIAKQTSDVSFTMSGVLLGTPRYMSPEQAEARSLSPIDHRTDIYSLGISLYEYLTGKPAFDAETPQELLAQIREKDPTAPRSHWREIPRDLETIILKSIAKVAGDRYETAAHLGADLRAFLEGRPIRARRLSLPARAARWAQRNRRTLVFSGGTVLATSVLATAVFLSWLGYWKWREGTVTLTTEGPPLVAELLDGEGQLVNGPFTVPVQSPVAVPSGSYRLQLSGEGFLSETFLLEIERGSHQKIDVGLDHRQLWKPIRVSGAFEVVALESREDIILLEKQGITRLHGETSETVWQLNLDPQHQPLLAETPGFTWYSSETYTPSGRGKFSRAPILIQPPPDLDGDGTGDLVWAFQHQAALLAISGKEGTILWTNAAYAGLAEELGLPVRLPRHAEDAISAALGPPDLADLDGDRTPDLLVTFACTGDAGGEPRRWIEAISGKTGKTLWRTILENHLFAIDQKTAVPYSCRWFHGGGSGITNTFTGKEIGSVQIRGWSRRISAWLPAPYPARLISGGRTQTVLCSAGSHLIILKPESGATAGAPHDLGFLPVRPPQIADFDSDGREEVLLLRQLPESEENPSGKVELVLLSPGSGETIWWKSLAAYWDALEWYEKPLEWPLLADLDGNGTLEVIVPALPDTKEKQAGNSPALLIINGETGADRLRASIPPGKSGSAHLGQPDRFTVGPDLDGDGSREIFLAILEAAGSQKTILAVEAISGKDGRRLWRWEGILDERWRSYPGPRLGPIRLWSRREGHSRLSVSYTGHNQELAKAFLLQAETGCLQSIGLSWRDPELADLDGDGHLDLYAFNPDRSNAFHHGGKLFAARGSPQKNWHRLGGVWHPAQDFDGDGITDSLGGHDASEGASELTTALSGGDGRILWRSDLNRKSYRAVSLPPPSGDVDGDGTPDVLAVRSDSTNIPALSPIECYSGKTGGKLWEAREILPLTTLKTQVVSCRDLDVDGIPEIAFFSIMDWEEKSDPEAEKFRRTPTMDRLKLWIVLLSGRTGKVVWNHEILGKNPFGGGSSPNEGFPVGVGDLQGDGVLDLVFSAPTGLEACVLRALDGRTGTILWQRSLSLVDEGTNLLKNLPRPTVGDMDGDGSVEVLVMDSERPSPGRRLIKALALQGSSGNIRWTWEGEGMAFVDAGKIRGHNKPYPLPVKLRREGPPAICLWTWNPQQVILLNPEGKLLERLIIPHRKTKPVPPNYGVLRVWSHDLDGDGAEELVFVGTGKLQAYRGGLENLLWDFALDDPQSYIEEIEPAQRDRSPTVLVHTPKGVLRVDGLTGEKAP